MKLTSSKKALIVEDNEINQLVTSQDARKYWI